MDLQARLHDVLKNIENRESTIETYESKIRSINNPNNSSFSKEFMVFPKIEKEPLSGPITIVPISDVHLGTRSCNIGKLIETLKLVMETPNCYTILMGGIMETATKTSVGMGVYDEEANIKEQLKTITRLLKPLADEGKILGMITGNHEMRISYSVSINPIEILADGLGINYFGFGGYISLRVGSQTYTIFAHHGASGSSTATGKLSAMRKLNQVALADIYLSGHTHGRMYDHDTLMTFDSETGQMRPFTRHYVVSGSFMEYWDGYGEMKVLPPSSTGVISLKLDPTSKHVQVML